MLTKLAEVTHSEDNWPVLFARLRGSNVNETTFLATDYLNHLNEAVMMIELVPSMPDMLEDVLAWERKSYQQHFADSEFKDKDLAVERCGHDQRDAVRPQRGSPVARRCSRQGQ